MLIGDGMLLKKKYGTLGVVMQLARRLRQKGLKFNFATFYLKIKPKTSWGCTSVLECLPSMSEVLGSISRSSPPHPCACAGTHAFVQKKSDIFRSNDTLLIPGTPETEASRPEVGGQDVQLNKGLSQH